MLVLILMAGLVLIARILGGWHRPTTVERSIGRLKSHAVFLTILLAAMPCLYFGSWALEFGMGIYFKFLLVSIAIPAAHILLVALSRK